MTGDFPEWAGKCADFTRTRTGGFQFADGNPSKIGIRVGSRGGLFGKHDATVQLGVCTDLAIRPHDGIAQHRSGADPRASPDDGSLDRRAVLDRGGRVDGFFQGQLAVGAEVGFTVAKVQPDALVTSMVDCAMTRVAKRKTSLPFIWT